MRWTCRRTFWWGCQGVRSCHSHKASSWRRCCHGWRRCIIRQDSICDKPSWPRRNIMTWKHGHSGLLKETLCTRKTWDAKQVCHVNCVLCLWVQCCTAKWFVPYWGTAEGVNSPSWSSPQMWGQGHTFLGTPSETSGWSWGARWWRCHYCGSSEFRSGRDSGIWRRCPWSIRWGRYG